MVWPSGHTLYCQAHLLLRRVQTLNFCLPCSNLPSWSQSCSNYKFCAVSQHNYSSSVRHLCQKIALNDEGLQQWDEREDGLKVNAETKCEKKKNWKTLHTSNQARQADGCGPRTWELWKMWSFEFKKIFCSLIMWIHEGSVSPCCVASYFEMFNSVW